MRRSLIGRAQAAGSGVIDLEPAFAAEAVMASALWRAFRAAGTPGTQD